DKKELSRKVEMLEEQLFEFGQKSSLELVKERVDLARAALIEKQKLEQVVKVLHTEQTLVEETINKLNGVIGKLENKIAE
ncbi:PspA/IM30 family protein, partial [Vibrio parahaemolyticus]|nr:PspA/IM30 family protein [Vibrio parahaemolyticus]